MNLQCIAGLAVVVALTVACAGPAATPTPTPVTRIEIDLSDAMHIAPDHMTVRAGQPVTFVVMNTGRMEHEFMLGDEAAQARHEIEMMGPGAMAHDHSYVIAVQPGQTRELVYTFSSAGHMLAGCHIPGHYPAGMKAIVTVIN